MSGLVAEGEEALGSVSIGGVEAPELTFQIVDRIGCAARIAAYCSELLAANDMFAPYAGVLGIDAVGVPDRCCVNPLPELAGGIGRRFIVHAALPNPTLTLNPDDAMLSGFTMLNVPGHAAVRMPAARRDGTKKTMRRGDL